ncbi:MAG: glucosyl-3-phosphoglycerate phosphatase [Sphingomonadales bacterium]|jgi:probable phosphoglycerate mutase|nr:glucosyl-3-phosphoglycerate phosphatase [Sphingomonadales bacterium]MEA3049964.1 glucosyl-3-phosphoglycerate phosphatase [Sphingomonadales bacterium]
MARWFIARHGETVFNAAGRIQGDEGHTPLTRAGFAQAEEMGEALRRRLGPKPPLALWSSPSGRALQTLAVIAEHLELDWHSARTDARLREIGMGEWSGAYYHDIVADGGPVFDSETWLFARRAPGGEDYADVAARLSAWLAETGGEAGDRLVLMHGMSARVLRGLMTGAEPHGDCRAPVAGNLPQGSVAEIVDGREIVLHVGSGR